MLKDRQTWHHSFKESWSCHNSFDSPSRAWRFKNSLSLFVLSPTAFLELSVRCYLSVFVFFSSLSVHLFLCAQQIPHSAIVLSFFSSLEEEVENFDVSSLQEEALRNIEADSFWCMSKLLDGIQVSVCLRLCLKDELLYTRCHFKVKSSHTFSLIIMSHIWTFWLKIYQFDWSISKKHRSLKFCKNDEHNISFFKKTVRNGALWLIEHSALNNHQVPLTTVCICFHKF